MALDPAAAGVPAMQPPAGPAMPAPSAQPAPPAPMPPQPAPQYHDVTVVTKKTYQCAKVEDVPPEEFGIERAARSIKDCNYCFHKVLVSESRLLDQGFDADQIKNIPTYIASTNQEELSRDTVDEHRVSGDELNSAARILEVTEHYIRMDYEGKGKAQLYRVTTGGGSDDILKRDGKPDIVPFDAVPFAAMTPVIIPHRFFGRSIADLIMDIQRIKTAITRQYLDNLYLANNPQKVVARNGSSPETIDDLLVSRPGGVIRVETQGAVEVLAHPDIGGQVLPAMQYFDASREFRTGVTRQGQGIDADALQNQSATAVNQLYSAAQAKMKLIARVFAETGIRDMFLLLHGIIRKHGSQQQTVRLRNEWVTVDPREWRSRNDMTVHVGLGSGGKQEQLQQITAIMNVQKEMLIGGLTNVVTPANIYASAKEMTRIVGHKDIDAFFTNPAGQPPPQQAPDPKLLQIQAQTDLQKQKQDTDAAHQQMKLQADATLEQQKFEHQKQLAMIEMDMKRQSHQMDLISRAATASGGAKDGEGGDPGQSTLAPLMMTLLDHLKAASAPKRVVRDAQGRVSHVEPVMQ